LGKDLRVFDPAMRPQNIVTILVNPENPDNIGAAARAIRNMGFSELRLVSPPANWRQRARKMAVSAGGVLGGAKVFRSLRDAVRDVGFLIGTTRRGGARRGSFLAFDEAVEKLRKISNNQKAGIVFGCESKGLKNEHILMCDYLMTIPTGRAYPSLNLAQAVIVSLFSVMNSAGRVKAKPYREKEPFLTKKEIEITLGHFEKALTALGYGASGANLRPRILRTLADLIKRNGILNREAQMIKGLSRKITEKVLSRS